MDWSKIDQAMVTKQLKDPDAYDWYNPWDNPFIVHGLYNYKVDRAYCRFPLSSLPLLHEKAPSVEILSHHTAGGQILFVTNAERIAVVAKLTGVHDMDHFAATGQCGIDCYMAFPGDELKFSGVTRFQKDSQSYACEIVRMGGTEFKKVVLNLPLYVGLEYLQIGLNRGAQVSTYPVPLAKPFVFYGSSITQGGCATRPGMLYTNILSRKMNREFLNFGFSGSAKGEVEVAYLLSHVPEPAAYVLAYEPNAQEGIIGTLNPFLDELRRSRKDVPILLISALAYPNEEHISPVREKREKLRKFQDDTVCLRRKNGDKQLFFIDGRELLKDTRDESFVDGVHPTDLGFWQIANALEPILYALEKNECSTSPLHP